MTTNTSIRQRLNKKDKRLRDWIDQFKLYDITPNLIGPSFRQYNNTRVYQQSRPDHIISTHNQYLNAWDINLRVQHKGIAIEINCKQKVLTFEEKIEKLEITTKTSIWTGFKICLQKGIRSRVIKCSESSTQTTRTKYIIQY